MDRVVIFSSTSDEANRFSEAIGGVWEKFGFNKDEKWVLFHDGNMEYMSNANQAEFDLLLVCESENEDDTYYDFLIENVGGFGKHILADDHLYVFCHGKTDTQIKNHQIKFIDALPGEHSFADEYTHSDHDDRYLAVVGVMEAGRDFDIGVDEYQSRLRHLLATLSFPALYDQAAEIQIRLFLKYLQAQGADVAEENLGDPQKSYEEFAKAALFQNAVLDEEGTPESLRALCSDGLEIGDRRQNMAEFGQHLNKILLSASGA